MNVSVLGIDIAKNFFTSPHLTFSKLRSRLLRKLAVTEHLINISANNLPISPKDIFLSTHTLALLYLHC